MTMRRYVDDMDPRVKLATALCLGPLVWRLDAAGTVVMAVCLGVLAVYAVPRSALGTAALRGNAVFVVLWAIAKCLFDVWGGVPPAAAALESAVLRGQTPDPDLFWAGFLAATTSPRRMGAALSYALTPFLGRRAWKAALALALLVHNLPLAWTAGAAIVSAMRRRCPDLPFARKPALFATALLRAVSLTAFDRPMAVAARNLDTPEAWRPIFPHPWRGGPSLRACWSVAVLQSSQRSASPCGL
jgi:biotin transport system permease protein